MPLNNIFFKHFFLKIQDESYHICWQIEGDQDYIINSLNRLCSSNTGLTFASKVYLNGNYEGKLIAYEANKYSSSCIGPIRYLWKPLDINETSANRIIWLWIHPSMYNQIETEFIKIFEIECEKIEPEIKKCKLEQEAVDNSVQDIKNLSFKTDKVHIQCLKDKLVRFKLLGPLSTTILKNALKLEDLSKAEINNNNKWSVNEELVK